MGLSDRDLLDIQALLARFVYCLDAGDPGGWTDTFAPDGSYVDTAQRLTGHAAIRPFIERLMTSGDAGPNGQPRLIHLHTPARIDGDGEQATAYSYWQAVTQTREGSVVIWRVGEFRDRLVKLNGTWRFEERAIPGLLGKTPLAEL
jgi:uncharacterized protein (TIGR02246 family)